MQHVSWLMGTKRQTNEHWIHGRRESHFASKVQTISIQFWCRTVESFSCFIQFCVVCGVYIVVNFVWVHPLRVPLPVCWGQKQRNTTNSTAMPRTIKCSFMFVHTFHLTLSGRLDKELFGRPSSANCHGFSQNRPRRRSAASRLTQSNRFSFHFVLLRTARPRMNRIKRCEWKRNN